MSILANLTLAYETLADDPIVKGISYGKSILSTIDAQIVEPAERAFAHLPSRSFVTRPTQTRPVHRGTYLHYASRSAAVPMRRQLVGAL